MPNLRRPAGRLVHSHGLEEWLSTRPDAGVDAIEAAVGGYLAHAYAPLDATITAGSRTADLGGKLTTRQMADEIIQRF